MGTKLFKTTTHVLVRSSGELYSQHKSLELAEREDQKRFNKLLRVHALNGSKEPVQHYEILTRAEFEARTA